MSTQRQVEQLRAALEAEKMQRQIVELRAGLREERIARELHEQKLTTQMELRRIADLVGQKERERAQVTNSRK